MTDTASHLRIVHVEPESSLRRSLGRLFIPGFDSPEVEFIQVEDLNIVREHLEARDFADAYIFHGLAGRSLAHQIHETARKPVLTTLLSANMDAIQIRVPDERIPMLDLLTHAPFAGFYTGNNVGREDPPSFSDWLRNEGITLPPVDTVSRNLSDVIASEVREHQGAFYLTPSQFLDGREGEEGHRRSLETRMEGYSGAEGVALLKATFGIKPGVGEGTLPGQLGIKRPGLGDARPPRGER